MAKVAGSAYVDWETLYADLAVGEPLVLKREPENPHDAHAIIVLEKKGNKLGVIAAVHNKGLAKILDAGESVKTIILKVDTTAIIHKLHIEVFTMKQEG